jgi:hypothetical protein
VSLGYVPGQVGRVVVSDVPFNEFIKEVGIHGQVILFHELIQLV